MSQIQNIFTKYVGLGVKVTANEVMKHAKTNHRFKSKTGALVDSIQVAIDSPTEARVYLNKTIAPYGGYVHEGTKAHIIVPKKKKALRFPKTDGSGFVFAKKVRHPGTKPDRFLIQAKEEQEKRMQNIFERYIQLATEEVANVLSR